MRTVTRVAVIVGVRRRARTARRRSGGRDDELQHAQGIAGERSVKGTITFDGIWTGAEAKSFGDVITAFNKKYPNVKVNYKPVGNNIPTVLATAVAGGHPPDMADIAQPGSSSSSPSRASSKPITTRSVDERRTSRRRGRSSARSTASCTRSSSRRANKSLLWYNVPGLQGGRRRSRRRRGRSCSTTAKTLKASGTPAYSIGGADGWTLTDLFENIYLRTFGQAKYDALTAHKIKWTDPSVTTALKAMGQIVGDSANIAGGTTGALQNGFNDVGHERVRDAAEGRDGVRGRLRRRRHPLVDEGEAEHRLQRRSVPDDQAGRGANGVEIGGDLFVTFRDTPAIKAFVKFLATAPAAASVGEARRVRAPATRT